MCLHLYNTPIGDLIDLLDLKLLRWQKNRSYLPEYIILGQYEKSLFVQLINLQEPAAHIDLYNYYKGVPVLFIENKHSFVQLI